MEIECKKETGTWNKEQCNKVTSTVLQAYGDSFTPPENILGNITPSSPTPSASRDTRWDEEDCWRVGCDVTKYDLE